MSPATLRLVLLISCAHAMVHVYEQSLPSVEQLVAADFSTEEVRLGAETTGPLGSAWRIPFGFGALAAGWLADRFGAKPMLIVYLLGCALTAGLAWWAPSISVLFAVMFAMGSFASIYHPAGLALVSHVTTPATRGAGLGWHGIFGSLGIAAAPLLAAGLFSFGDISWRDYYLLLMLPGALLAVALAAYLPNRRVTDAHSSTVDGSSEVEEPGRWAPYFLLVAVGTIYGFVYAALTHFLPRYLDSVGLRSEGVSDAGFRTLLAGVVLLCGAFGQGVAGRLARPERLERLMVAVSFANAPCLLWMALAEGPQRLWATCVMAFVHFMNQPIYNSLIAKYVPRRRRSTGYGFSNMMCFGLGALGPSYAGFLLRYADSAQRADLLTYGSLAGLALIGGLLALPLLRMGRS